MSKLWRGSKQGHRSAGDLSDSVTSPASSAVRATPPSYTASDLEEDLPPDQGPPPFTTRPTLQERREDTRTKLTYIMLALLVFVTLGPTVALSAGWLSLEEVQGMALIIQPVQTIFGVAIGFYFASEDRLT